MVVGIRKSAIIKFRRFHSIFPRSFLKSSCKFRIKNCSKNTALLEQTVSIIEKYVLLVQQDQILFICMSSNALQRKQIQIQTCAYYA